MPAALKLLIGSFVIFIAILFLLPSISLASKEGFFIKTGMGIFYIPSLTSIKVIHFPKNDNNLEKMVKESLKNSEATYGVVVKNLTSGQEYLLNQTETFKSASLYKIMLMATVYNEVANQRLSFDQDIYQKIERMITLSSNEDAWYLAGLVGWNTIENMMKDLGLTKTKMSNPPISTPNDILSFLEKLQERKLVSKAYSEEMLKLMYAQKTNDRIPRYFPREIKVAHKTGEHEDVRHDVGIVNTANNDYIIILMSKNVTDEVEVKETMASLSKNIYDYFEAQWQSPPRIL